MIEGSTPIPNEILYDGNLSGSEFHVLAIVYAECHKRNSRAAWSTSAELAEASGLKQKTIANTINRLVKKGYLHKQKLKNTETNRHQLMYWPRWWLNGHPVPVENNPWQDPQLKPAYYKTKMWKKKAEAAKERAGNKCQVCYSSKSLHAHHRTYDRFGDEAPDDLTVLCQSCHKLFHRERSLKR